MKSLFYGTPDVAVPYLELLASKTQVVGVVSQPDKPAGRGLSVQPTPVKKKALELGLRLWQPAKPSEISAELAAAGADVAVCVAYGRLLKRDVLDAPKHGTLNVHFSLLPKYRGAAPVQWALARGETRTGVSVFWLDEGMDTGPVFTTRETIIAADEDASQLLPRLGALGLEALSEALTELQAGRKRAVPQAGEPSSAPLIKPEDARLDLVRPAAELHNITRGFRLWPRAYLERGGKRLLVLKTRVGEPGPGSPGTVVSVDRSGGILIQCGTSSRLWFLAVQPEGKKPISAAEFANGLRLRPGDSFSFDRT